MISKGDRQPLCYPHRSMWIQDNFETHPHNYLRQPCLLRVRYYTFDIEQMYYTFRQRMQTLKYSILTISNYFDFSP